MFVAKHDTVVVNANGMEITPTTATIHISIVEQLDGKSADWMEQVSDEQYRAS